MLNAQIPAQLAKLYNALLHERRNELLREFSKIKGNMASRGLSMSGIFTGEVVKQGNIELQERATLLWKTMLQVTSSLGVKPTDPELAADLKELASKHLDEQATEIRPATLQAVAGQHFDANALGNALDAQRRRYEAEIDLFAAGLKQQAALPQSATAVYNFHGAVGAVQTGPGATAYVHQDLSGEAKTDIRVALTKIEVAVAAPGVPPDLRADVAALVPELRAELEKPRPSQLRLVPLLAAIGGAIQTLAALPGAADTVRAAAAAARVALAHFGIPL